MISPGKIRHSHQAEWWILVEFLKHLRPRRFLSSRGIDPSDAYVRSMFHVEGGEIYNPRKHGEPKLIDLKNNCSEEFFGFSSC
jgi:hypothetical protein